MQHREVPTASYKLWQASAWGKQYQSNAAAVRDTENPPIAGQLQCCCEVEYANNAS